ncbi:MAG: PhoH family protein [Leptonema sp. (in: bacteria)]
MYQKQYVFEDQNLFHYVCGVSDKNILELEQLLKVEIIPRGNSLILRSNSNENIDNALYFLEQLDIYYRNREIEKFDLRYLFSLLRKNNFSNGSQNLKDTNAFTKARIFANYKGKEFYAKTLNQFSYIQSIQRNPITIGVGPAGTGKTFLSVITSVKMLLNGEIERLIITRPAVEAGENLGFLPGDFIQKVDPYLRPIYDALFDALGTEKTSQLIQLNKIEVAPLAYMRGRTLNDSLIILDEAQNCTLSQLKMFLTRIGKNSKMCICGDITQSDLKPGLSGLEKIISILKNIQEIQIVYFSKEDIVRNPIVEKVIHAFEEYENSQ